MSAALRRRLLFVAYWIPPRAAIGAIRSTRILKGLPALGWDVDVVTARFEDGAAAPPPFECLQTGYYDIKHTIKRLTGIGTRSTSEVLNLRTNHGTNPSAIATAVRLAVDLMTYPDEYIGWLPFALRAVRNMMASERYDAMLTTSPPVTANILAALTSGGVPWVADLRDLWSEDDSTQRSGLRRLLDDKVERATLSRASALIATSELSAQRFRNRYPGKRCTSISTGFDAEEWCDVPFGAESACTLLYVGSLFGGKRDPTVLFAALREIFAQGLANRRDLRVVFYCAREPWLTEMIEEYALTDVVDVHSLIDRRTVLALERRADRLVVLCWDGPTAEGIVPGKLFEYFGARRRILAIGGPPQSAVEHMLKDTGAGARCRTTEDVKREILRAVAEHRAGAVIVPQAAVEAYNGESCAARFAEVLESVARRADKQLA